MFCRGSQRAMNCSCLRVSTSIEDLDNGVIQISGREETITDPVTYPTIAVRTQTGVMRGAAKRLSEFQLEYGRDLYYVLDAWGKAIAERLGISPLYRVEYRTKSLEVVYGSMRKLQLYSRGRRKDDNVGLGGRG
jgi:hypothetical protein